MSEEVKPRIDSVRFYTATKVRPKPRAGDRRTTKLHGLQIRVYVRARDIFGNPIGLVVSRGRPVFQWV